MAPSQTAKEALEEYYRVHYFGDEALTASVAWIRIGPVQIPFPNPKQRREAIELHDLTHLLTGYDTSWAGEGEVAAFELASGFPAKYWIGWIYAPITFTIGCLVAPKRVVHAFRRGLGQNNLYKLDLPREKLFARTIDSLKNDLALER